MGRNTGYTNVFLRHDGNRQCNTSKCVLARVYVASYKFTARSYS